MLFVLRSFIQYMFEYLPLQDNVLVSGDTTNQKKSPYFHCAYVLSMCACVYTQCRCIWVYNDMFT